MIQKRHFIKHQNIKILYQLININPEYLNEYDSNGFTILHLAIIKKNSELVEILCEIGCDAKKNTKNGESCLHLAVISNSPKILQYLLMFQNFDPNEYDLCSTNPLISAIDIENPNIIDLLIANGSNLRNRSYVKKYDQFLTPIAYCIYENKIPMIYRLLNFIGPTFMIWKRIEEKAIELDDDITLKTLMNTTHTLNISAKELLFQMAFHNSFKCAELISIYVPSFDFLDDTPQKCPAIYFAIIRGNLEICKFFMQKYIELGKLSYDICLNVLINACSQSNNEITNYFLSQKLDPNVKTLDLICPIHVATEKNMIDNVKCLISYGALINSKTKLGDTPLHIATKNDHEKIVNLLIEHGSEINTVDQNGNTPIHLAIKNANLKLTSILIDYASVDAIRIVNNEGHTIMNKAIVENHIQIVELIANKAPYMLEIMPESDKQHYINAYQSCLQIEPPLMTAIRSQNIIAIKELLSKGCNPNCQYTYSRKYIPMFQAINQKNIKILKCLFYFSNKIQLDLNLKDENEESAIHKAILSDNLRIINFLINHGCDVYISDHLGNNIMHFIAKNIKRDTSLKFLLKILPADVINILINAKNKAGFLPLHISIFNENIEILSQFLGSSVFKKNNLANDRNLHILHCAASRNSFGCLEYMIKNCKNLKKTLDSDLVDGYTSFHFACVKDSIDSLRLLTKNFPKFLDKNSLDRSLDPLHICAQFDSDKCARFIYEYRKKKDLDIESKNGFTPLHIASFFKSYKVIKLLVSEGSNLNSVSKTNLTPLELAVQSGCSDEIIELLENDPFFFHNQNLKGYKKKIDQLKVNFLMLKCIDHFDYEENRHYFVDFDIQYNPQDCQNLSDMLDTESSHNIISQNARDVDSNLCDDSNTIEILDKSLKELTNCKSSTLAINDNNFMHNYFKKYNEVSDISINYYHNINDSCLSLTSISDNQRINDKSTNFNENNFIHDNIKCHDQIKNFLELKIDDLDLNNLIIKGIIKPLTDGLIKFVNDKRILIIIPPMVEFSSFFSMKICESSLSSNIVYNNFILSKMSQMSTINNYQLHHILNMESLDRKLAMCLHITLPLAYNIPSNNFHIVAFESKDCLTWNQVDSSSLHFCDLTSYNPKLDEILDKNNETIKHFGFNINYLFKFLTFILTPRFRRIEWCGEMSLKSNLSNDNNDSPYFQVLNHKQYFSIRYKKKIPPQIEISYDHDAYYCIFHLYGAKPSFIKTLMDMLDIVYISNLVIIRTDDMKQSKDSIISDSCIFYLHYEIDRAYLSDTNSEFETFILYKPEFEYPSYNSYQEHNDKSLNQWKLIKFDQFGLIKNLKLDLNSKSDNHNFVEFETSSVGSFILFLNRVRNSKNHFIANNSSFPLLLGNFFTQNMNKPRIFYNLKILKKYKCKEYTILIYPQHEDLCISSCCESLGMTIIFSASRYFIFFDHLDFRLMLFQSGKDKCIMDETFSKEKLVSPLYIDIKCKKQKNILENVFFGTQIRQDDDVNNVHNLFLQIYQYPIEKFIAENQDCIDISNKDLGRTEKASYQVFSELIH